MSISLNHSWYVFFKLFEFYFESCLLAGLSIYKLELNLSVKLSKSNVEDILGEMSFIFRKVEFIEFIVIFVYKSKIYVFLIGRSLFLFNSKSLLNSLDYYLSTSTKYFSSYEINKFEDINLFNESFKKCATFRGLLEYGYYFYNEGVYSNFEFSSLSLFGDCPFVFEPIWKKRVYDRMFKQIDGACIDFMTNNSNNLNEFTIIRIWLLFVKSKELFVKDSKLLFVKDHTVFADNYLEYLSDNFIVICQQLSVKYPFSFMEFNPLDLGINYLQKAKKFMQENSAILSFEFLYDWISRSARLDIHNKKRKFSIK